MTDPFVVADPDAEPYWTRVPSPIGPLLLIGRDGAMLKRIGTEARQEMERLFGIKIFLNLHVRVQPGWREKAAFLDALDWRTMAGRDDT